MFIGEILKKRMDALGIDSTTLANEVMLDISCINKIINNETPLSEIDEIDLEFISDVLHCRPQYFYDASERDKDLIHSSMNRGIDDIESSRVKGKIQNFTRDLLFLKNIMLELNQ